MVGFWKKFTKRGYQALVFWPVARVLKEKLETVGERQLIGHRKGVGGASHGAGNNERTEKDSERMKGKEKRKWHSKCHLNLAKILIFY